MNNKKTIEAEEKSLKRKSSVKKDEIFGRSGREINFPNNKESGKYYYGSRSHNSRSTSCDAVKTKKCGYVTEKFLNQKRLSNEVLKKQNKSKRVSKIVETKQGGRQRST